MTPAARVKYHRDFWPAACRAKRWDHRDQELRRKVAVDCMRQVRGPLVTTSDPRFGPDETTALFVYLAFLANQASLDKSAAWDECRRDYKTFNRARNADWHERETYGTTGSQRLQRERFGRRKSASGDVLDSLDKEETRKRHMTMASRHRAKAAQEKGAAAARAARSFYTPGTAVPPEGSIILLPPPRGQGPITEPVEVTAGDDPAYVAPKDQPF